MGNQLLCRATDIEFEESVMNTKKIAEESAKVLNAHSEATISLDGISTDAISTDGISTDAEVECSHVDSGLEEAEKALEVL